MRDTHKNRNYFEAQLEDGERRREKFVKLLETDDTEQARQADLHALYKIQTDKATSLYCLGAPVEEVVEEFNKSWPIFIKMMNYSASTSMPIMKKKQFVPGVKLTVFPLLLLCNPEREIAHRIFDFTNSELNYQLNKQLKEVDAGFDPFTYRFAEYFGYTSERIYPELCWAELYEPLNACFVAREQDRPKILSDYMDGWLKRALKEDIYVKDAHLKPTNKNFRGYWCFPAAAVAKKLHIDDSALKNHPHYPYDLGHYGK